MSKRLLLGALSGASLGLALALRSAPRIPAFSGTAEGEAPWLLLSVPDGPDVAVLVLLVLTGGLAGFFAARARHEATLTPFLLAGLSGAVFVPGVFSFAPFTAALSGRFLDFVLVTAALVSGWRLAASAVRSPRLPSANVVAVGGFIVCAGAGYLMWEGVGLSGDEPHYLLITESLVRDGDLRVQDNYFRGDYRGFYSGKIGPHLASGTAYSIHGIGLPLLVFPGYLLAGLAGVSLTLAAVSALLWRSLFESARLLTGSTSAALVATLGFGLTSPALFLSPSLYPELPAAAIVALVVLRWLREGAPGWRLLGWGALVGVLPFFHMKFLPLGGLLAAALALRFRRDGRDGLVALGLGFGFATLSLLLFFFFTTGSLDPTAAYGRQRIFLANVPTGLAGLLFDQEFGLLLASPFYVAALAGVAVLVRARRGFGVLVVLALAFVALPGAAHPLWNGGNSPPARFLFPALPLVALGAAALWASRREHAMRSVFEWLLAVSVALAGFTLLLPGQPLYLNQRDGTARLWEALSSSWDVTSYLPSVVRGDTRSLVVIAVLLVLLTTVLVAVSRDRAFPGLPVPLVVVAGALAQDVTGVVPSRALEGRWVSGFLMDAAREEPERFIALPERDELSLKEALARVPLRLRPNRSDGDARHWWSLPYGVPGGRYRVAGVAVPGWSPCHDQVCFPVGAETPRRFETKVALARFRLRARRLREPPPRVYAEALYGVTPLAEESLALRGGTRLHVLDDGAYTDRRGFWVKSKTRAGFALELPHREAPNEIRLSNGGVENWVRLETSRGVVRFRLAPWESRRVALPVEDGLGRFSILSEGGFQPSALDPESTDHRKLGVLVGASAFDFER